MFYLHYSTLSFHYEVINKVNSALIICDRSMTSYVNIQQEYWPLRDELRDFIDNVLSNRGCHIRINENQIIVYQVSTGHSEFLVLNSLVHGDNISGLIVQVRFPVSLQFLEIMETMVMKELKR